RDVAGWMLATGVGIVISWLGVRAVLDAAVPDRFLAVPAAEQGPPRAGLTAAPVAPSPTGRPGPARPTPSRSGARSVAPTASAAPPPETTPPPSTVDGWTPLGDGQYLRSFRLFGGEAVVRAGQGSVRLVSATPRPGFAMTVVSGGPDRVVVDFAGGLHISTLDVSWRTDGPAADVTELP
ncbi:MAG: hypothetical protein QOI74_715, partial [Micromonosporaceae bacterium]|nr:hypothetical protein [Micromonosporaceae bacterium]